MSLLTYLLTYHCDCSEDVPVLLMLLGDRSCYVCNCVSLTQPPSPLQYSLAFTLYKSRSSSAVNH